MAAWIKLSQIIQKQRKILCDLTCVWNIFLKTEYIEAESEVGCGLGVREHGKVWTKGKKTEVVE